MSTKSLRFWVRRILIALAICTMALSFSSCVFVHRDYAEVFKNNWKIDLPADMEEEFSKSEDNWGTHGIRYAVFRLKEEPADFIADFIVEADEEIENIVDALLSAANFTISKYLLPDWTLSYYWKHVEKEYKYREDDIVLDHCYMIYFPDSLRLAICQYFP